jgi:hypothetical protein
MPDNAVYFYAACVALTVLYAGYVVSLWQRARAARARPAAAAE